MVLSILLGKKDHVRHIESHHQIAYFEWLLRKHKDVYEMTTANAAGGKRNKREAHRLRCEGVKPSWPDILVAWPTKAHHGLFIELKAPKGRPTKLQIEKIKHLNAKGYCAGVCYGVDEAIEATHNYLSERVICSYPEWLFGYPE